jgi:hypothetical protein
MAKALLLRPKPVPMAVQPKGAASAVHADRMGGVAADAVGVARGVATTIATSSVPKLTARVRGGRVSCRPVGVNRVRWWALTTN